MMKPWDDDPATSEETRIISDEVARTAAEVRDLSRSNRAGVHERMAEGEHAIEGRMLAVAGETADPEGVRRRGHAWSARAEEHSDRAAELRGGLG